MFEVRLASCKCSLRTGTKPGSVSQLVYRTNVPPKSHIELCCCLVFGIYAEIGLATSVSEGLGDSVPSRLSTLPVLSGDSAIKAENPIFDVFWTS